MMGDTAAKVRCHSREVRALTTDLKVDSNVGISAASVAVISMVCSRDQPSWTGIFL